MSKRSAFVDTMLFLHFRPLDEIDWVRLLGADEVEILLSPVVWRQLDRHKDQHPVAGLRDRARNAVGRLKRWLPDVSGIIRPGVVLRLIHDDPRIDFAAHRLSREIADDQLIATAIEYRDTKGQDVAIVTEDMLLKAKAKAAGLTAVMPNEADRLPDALSDQEKKLRALQAENQALKSRRPQLKVSFDSGDTYIEAKLRPIGPLTSPERERRMARVRERYPLKDIPNEESHGPGWDSRQAAAAVDRMKVLFSGMERHAAEEYNEDVNRYVSEYAEYLDREWAHRQYMARALTFTIRLSNSGTAPASDIDFNAQSDASDIFAYKKTSSRLHGPDPPREPEVKTRPLDFLSLPSPLVPSFRPPYVPGPVWVSLKNRKKGGFVIEAHVKKLKHLQTEDFGPFVMIFPSDDAIRPIQLHYQLNCDDLPENLEGILHLNASAVLSPIDGVPKP